MARLTLSYEQCAALREAAEKVPAAKRSSHLNAALRILRTIMEAVEGGRAMLDGPADGPSSDDRNS